MSGWPSGSVDPVPLKPTWNGALPVGVDGVVAIRATGPLLVTVTTTDAVVEPPRLSVTFTRAVCAPRVL